jgi:hypothetical protein
MIYYDIFQNQIVDDTTYLLPQLLIDYLVAAISGKLDRTNNKKKF